MGGVYGGSSDGNRMSSTRRSLKKRIGITSTSKSTEFTGEKQQGERERRSNWCTKDCTAWRKLDRVPLFTMRVSDGLWLMNKAGLLQLEHFNKANALSWAITMGSVCDAGDLFGARLEPDRRRILLHPTWAAGPVRVDGARGRVYQIAAENLERLKDEIYRVCYLSQASGEDGGGRT